MIDKNSDYLVQAIEVSRAEDCRTALRALLSKPLWVAGEHDEDMFVKIRAHQSDLIEWLQRHTGWSLIVRSDSARLIKHPVNIMDATRGAIDASSVGAPLSRQRYVLWCLVLATLQLEGRQTTLRKCAEQSIRSAEEDPRLTELGVSFDLKSVDTRRSLICIIKMLMAHGVLDRVAGNEDGFVGGSGDCLYNIRVAVLSDLLCLRRGPSTIVAQDMGERLRSLVSETYREMDDNEDEALRNRQIEHRLTRRLLDDPVMYLADLTERERSYWQSQRSRIISNIESATGLVAESRAEGVAMLDPFGELTDIKMPEAGTLGHATLLVAEFLAEQRRCHLETENPLRHPNVGSSQELSVPSATCRIPIREIELQMRLLARLHASHWRKGVEESVENRLLLEQVLSRLEQLMLIQREEDEVEPRPAIARFATLPHRVAGAKAAKDTSTRQ